MVLPITLGADPEFFLESLAGEIKSAINQVGGSKADPLPLRRQGFFVQEDNVAVEFNIPPAKTVKAFVESITWSISTITDTVKAQNMRPKLSVTEIFPPYELCHPSAHEFGCDPDFNAWMDGTMNPRPQVSEVGLRSCGGHIHIGIQRKLKTQEEREQRILDIIKAMDLFLGVPAIMMDDNTTRRTLYGQAGAFRYQTYAPLACEYRVLSNFWIKSPELMTWAYKQSLRAVNHMWKMGHKKFHKFLEEDQLAYKIQHCINKSDVTLAQQLIEDYNLATV